MTRTKRRPVVGSEGQAALPVLKQAGFGLPVLD